MRLAGTASWRASSVGETPISSIVHDLDVVRAKRTSGPAEANSPLSIDANAGLASPIALQGFQTVAPQRPQIVEAGGCVNNRQPFRSLSGKTREGSFRLAARELGGPLVPIARIMKRRWPLNA